MLRADTACPAPRAACAEREAVYAEEQARRARRVEGQRGRLGERIAGEADQHEADEEPGHDPADRAEDANQRKLLLLVRDVVERQRVASPSVGM
jgi:hypothetical protein